MNEQWHTITIPDGVSVNLCGCTTNTVKLLGITRETAVAIRAQCEAIEAQPEEPTLRVGDIWIGATPGIWRVNLTGSNSRPASWATSTGLVLNSLNMTQHHYVANLCDLLAQGDILVAVSEDQLIELGRAAYTPPLCAKLTSYLADCRERQRKRDGHEE